MKITKIKNLDGVHKLDIYSLYFYINDENKKYLHIIGLTKDGKVVIKEYIGTKDKSNKNSYGYRLYLYLLKKYKLSHRLEQDVAYEYGELTTTHIEYSDLMTSNVEKEEIKHKLKNPNHYGYYPVKVECNPLFDVFPIEESFVTVHKTFVEDYKETKYSKIRIEIN